MILEVKFLYCYRIIWESGIVSKIIYFLGKKKKVMGIFINIYYIFDMNVMSCGIKRLIRILFFNRWYIY